MSTDLYGKPLKPKPPFELSLTRKRQAALLYHFASLDYLKELKAKVDDLMAWLDTAMERRRRVDAVGMRDMGWQANDTTANWGTNAWPHLKEMQQSLSKDILQRAFEIYSQSGVSSYFRGADEISTLWMAPEQEQEYKKRRDDILSCSRTVDYIGTLSFNRRFNEQIFDSLWRKYGQLFPRLPKFRVLTDVELDTEKKPPRTGVYVPQDDAYGTLQFGWRGGNDGALGDMYTLGDFGRQVAAHVGYDYLWTQDGKLNALFKSSHYIDDFKQYRSVIQDPDAINNPLTAAAYLSTKAFIARPGKWYYVEKLEGEYDDAIESSASPTELRGRVEGGQPCTREGWWFTPAQVGSRRYFKEGEVMPNFERSYGSVIWQWDTNQAAP